MNQESTGPYLLVHAQEKYAAYEFEGAARMAAAIVDQHVEHGAAWALLGQALLRCEKFNEGVEAIEYASLLAPLTDDARIELAIGYAKLGRLHLARDLLMMVAVSGRLDACQLLRVATGLETAHELKLAMEACRRAGQQSPEFAEVHYQMAYFASRCGHAPTVVEALMRHAMDLEPRNIHYRIGLASLLIRLQRSSEAILILNRSVPQQLSEIVCRCCLQRMAHLYFDCDDVERAHLCVQRLQEVERKMTLRTSGGNL